MFKEARNKSEYSGFINLVLEKKDNKTIAVKKYYEGLVKISPTIKMDIENIPTYYLLQLGGGYIEGEKYNAYSCYRRYGQGRNGQAGRAGP